MTKTTTIRVAMTQAGLSRGHENCHCLSETPSADKHCAAHASELSCFWWWLSLLTDRATAEMDVLSEYRGQDLGLPDLEFVY